MHRMSTAVGLLILGWSLTAGLVQAERPGGAPPSAAKPDESGPIQGKAPGKLLRTPPSERTLDYWAAQLSHERFLRRQSAQRHLVGGGQASIPVLRKMLDQGDLETTENVISVLARIAENEEPWRDDGAGATLESLAQNSFGTKATLAKTTLKSFSETRASEARIRLAQAGVFVGPDTVALGARSRLREVVRIGPQWNGDLEILAWLRWLGDVTFVVVQGTAAAKPQVFTAITKMPGLETLVVADCELTLPSVEALQGQTRIDAMELRYVRLDEERLREISKIRIRNSLYLMGTKVSDDRVERLRVEMPGLEISHRRGGFLGVICRSTLEDFCEVSEVMPGSGAAEAGLQSGDVIIRIDDVKITRFEDLQRQINTHEPGDQVAIRFRRHGDVVDASATLKKLNNQ
jgi:hypothetical protein